MEIFLAAVESSVPTLLAKVGKSVLHLNSRANDGSPLL